MSDSDEFGGLAPTTPLPNANNVKRKARSDKPPSNAGPSKPPSSMANGSNSNFNARKKAKVVTSGGAANAKKPGKTRQGEVVEEEDAEMEEVDRVVHEEVQVEEEDADPVPPHKQPRGDARNAVPVKSKGRQKAPSQQAAPGRSKQREDDEEDEQDMDVDSDGEEAAPGNGKSLGTAASNRRQNGHPPKAPNRSSQEAKLTAENERLLAETERLKAHLEDLKEKFEEMMHTRLTEPERLMEEMVESHEAKTKVQNEIIQQLHAQLAKKEPLLRGSSSGKKAGLSLISRDEADDEVREYKVQVQNLKNELQSAKKVIQERDERIADLQVQVQETRRELQEEIKRSADLARQHRVTPGSATRNTVLKGEDPKTSRVIRLYEDLTNILVPVGKYTAADDSWNFTCIYTWTDESDDKHPENSLSFNLRLCKEPSSDNPSKLVEQVHYVPDIEMSSNRPDFVEMLGFLAKPFSFPQTQLSLFVRTLYDNLNNSESEDQE